MYFGDIGKNSSILTSYFESQGAHPCPPDANPAEWMLQVIGAAPGAVATRDYADAWRESKEYAEMKKELARKREIAKAASITNKKERKMALAPFAASFGAQLMACTHRVFQQYWRTPSYIYSKLALCLLTVRSLQFPTSMV